MQSEFGVIFDIYDSRKEETAERRILLLLALLLALYQR